MKQSKHIQLTPQQQADVALIRIEFDLASEAAAIRYAIYLIAVEIKMNQLKQENK